MPNGLPPSLGLFCTTRSPVIGIGLQDAMQAPQVARLKLALPVPRVATPDRGRRRFFRLPKGRLAHSHSRPVRVLPSPCASIFTGVWSAWTLAGGQHMPIERRDQRLKKQGCPFHPAGHVQRGMVEDLRDHHVRRQRRASEAAHDRPAGRGWSGRSLRTLCKPAWVARFDHPQAARHW